MAFPILFIPWLLLYDSVVNLGPRPNAFETYRLGELHWPIYQWMELLYASPYLLVTVAPFFIRINRLLRRFVVTGILGTVIGHLMFLIVPAIATPRPFQPHGVLGAMMVLERVLDGNGCGALPSFHVFWVFLGASVFGATWPRWRHVWWLWAVAVSLSCVFTGVHSVADIVAGFGLFLLTWFHQPIWRWLNRPAPNLGHLPTAAMIELAWNVVLVIVMLQLGHQSVPLTIILKVYLLLWMLARLAQHALESAVTTTRGDDTAATFSGAAATCGDSSANGRRQRSLMETSL